MAATRLTTEHTTGTRPTSTGSDRSVPVHGGEHEPAKEGVIYCTPDGDGYILYATDRSTDRT